MKSLLVRRRRALTIYQSVQHERIKGILVMTSIIMLVGACGKLCGNYLQQGEWSGVVLCLIAALDLTAIGYYIHGRIP